MGKRKNKRRERKDEKKEEAMKFRGEITPQVERKK